MDSITICGNLGKEPVMRYTKDGVAVCNVSVACDGGKDSDGYSTVWFDVTFWSETADLVNATFKKGDTYKITGKPKDPRIWKKDDGSLWLDKEGNPKANNQMTGWSFMKVRKTTSYEEVETIIPDEPEPVKAK